MDRIVINAAQLSALLTQLLARPQQGITLRVGENNFGKSLELLCRPATAYPHENEVFSSGSDGYVFFTLVDQAAQQEAAGRDNEMRRMAAEAEVFIHRKGHLQAFIGPARTPGEVRISGPGMYVFSPLAGHSDQQQEQRPQETDARWSRTQGALGRSSWLRLTNLHVGLIGTGRNGSLMACSLAKLGLSRITMVDPDRVEEHNLDAMAGVRPCDLNLNKVEIIAGTLMHEINPHIEVRAIPESITILHSLLAIKRCDLLVCCVDDDGARAVVGLMATLYNRPLLDVGTGIFGQGEHRRMGADIRLILPGEGCLFCGGGFANTAAVENLRHRKASFRNTDAPATDWHTQRTGSLLSLNHIATGIGCRMIEDLVGQRIEHSLWQQFTYDSRGIARLEVVPITHEMDIRCPVCACTGLGDAGLNQIPQLIDAWLQKEKRS